MPTVTPTEPKWDTLYPNAFPVSLWDYDKTTKSYFAKYYDADIQKAQMGSVTLWIEMLSDNGEWYWLPDYYDSTSFRYKLLSDGFQIEFISCTPDEVPIIKDPGNPGKQYFRITLIVPHVSGNKGTSTDTFPLPKRSPFQPEQKASPTTMSVISGCEMKNIIYTTKIIGRHSK